MIQEHERGIRVSVSLPLEDHLLRLKEVRELRWPEFSILAIRQVKDTDNRTAIVGGPSRVEANE